MSRWSRGQGTESGHQARPLLAQREEQRGVRVGGCFCSLGLAAPAPAPAPAGFGGSLLQARPPLPLGDSPREPLGTSPTSSPPKAASGFSLRQRLCLHVGLGYIVNLPRLLGESTTTSIFLGMQMKRSPPCYCVCACFVYCNF